MAQFLNSVPLAIIASPSREARDHLNEFRWFNRFGDVHSKTVQDSSPATFRPSESRKNAHPFQAEFFIDELTRSSAPIMPKWNGLHPSRS
jgi:hypothetical protein